jgi:lipoprotein NlpI
MLGRLILLALAATLALSAAGRADSLYEAPNALVAARAALEGAAGGKLQALRLTIAPAEVSVDAANPGNPRHLDGWSFRFGSLRVRGPAPAEPGPVGADFAAALFDLDTVDFNVLPGLAAAALQRAALEDRAHIARMTLERPVPLLGGGTPGAPRWAIEIDSGRENATIYADAAGRITGTDLSGTNRARRLDLLDQTALLPQAAKDFREAMGAGPILRRVSIGAKGVAFETTLPDDASPLAGSGLKTALTLRWNLDGLQRRLGRVGVDTTAFIPADAPFAIDEARWDLVPKLEAAARAALAMPQGVVTAIELSRPTDVVGRPALQWRIEVSDGDQRGAVLATMDGSVFQTLPPEGRRKPTDWRTPAAIVEAFRRIDQAFGTGAQLAEILVYDDKVTVTARDPRDPGSFVQALLRDDGFERFGTPSQFSIGNRAFVIADLAPLSAERLVALEADALKRLGLPPGTITTITIGRGGMDPSPEGNVAVEIRAEDRPFGRGGRVDYEMDGRVIKEYLPDPPSAAAQVEAECAQQGDPARALAACSRLLDDPATSPPDRAIAYTNRGLAYAATGALDRAIADQSAAIKLQPDYANPYNNRGLAYDQQGDVAHAIADYDAALEREPGSAIVLHNRALARIKKGDLDDATSDIDASILAEPDNGFGYYLRGFVHLRRGELEDAAAAFDTAVQKGTRFAALLRLRGRTLHALGRVDRALSDYEAALEMAPQDASAHLDHALALLYRGDLAAAESELAAAQRLAPKDPYAAIWLVIVQRRRGGSGPVDATGAVDRTAWPGQVLDLLAGTMTADALLAAATDPDARKQRGRICEAHFYTAALRLLQGKPADAKPLLQAADADCPRDFTEWDAARAELAVLGAKP